MAHKISAGTGDLGWELHNIAVRECAGLKQRFAGSGGADFIFPVWDKTMGEENLWPARKPDCPEGHPSGLSTEPGIVADWLLSSLLLMATKALALCGALPSTPCCGCCFWCPSLLHWGIRPWLIQNPSEHTVKAARARLLGLCGFLPPALLPDVLSFLSFLLASACLLPPAPLFFLCWFCPPRCLLSCLVLLALCVVCLCPLPRFCFFWLFPVRLRLTSAYWGYWGWLRTITHTHPPLWLPPSLLLRLGLVCPLIRLFVVSAWLFCCLVPLARTSYSEFGMFLLQLEFGMWHSGCAHWFKHVARQNKDNTAQWLAEPGQVPLLVFCVLWEKGESEGQVIICGFSTCVCLQVVFIGIAA